MADDKKRRTASDTIYEKLDRVRERLSLSSQKRKYETYGSISEGVKPFLKDERLFLLMSDEVIAAGNTAYIRATARISDMQTGETAEAGAVAENETNIEEASARARTYALASLFLVKGVCGSGSEYMDGVDREKQAAEEKKNAWLDKINATKEDAAEPEEAEMPVETTVESVPAHIPDFMPAAEPEVKEQPEEKKEAVINIVNVVEEVPAPTPDDESGMVFDFDLDSVIPNEEPAPVHEEETAEVPFPEVEAKAEEPVTAPVVAADDMDFDFSLSDDFDDPFGEKVIAEVVPEEKPEPVESPTGEIWATSEIDIDRIRELWEKRRKKG